MQNLIELALARRPVVLMLTLALVMAGWLAWMRLPIDAFPDVSSTQVKVIIKAPGMTPEEVESRITVVLEQELLGIPHQTLVRSTSKYALADITLDFDDSTDIYWARQQVGERLNQALKELPPSASGGLAPITTPLGEMFMFTLEGPQSLADKRQVLDWVIRPALRTVPGVAEVNSLGGQVRTFEVVPDALRLQASGVTMDELQQALERHNRNDGAGRINAGEETWIVRAQGAIQTLDDARQTVVHHRNGQTVRVADVADVRVGHLTRYGGVTRDGKGEAVQGLVLGLKGANARDVVHRVQQELATLAPSLPPGMKVDVFYDRSHLVERAVHTVGKALLEAIVLVLLLLLAFLGNLRAALVVALMLPLAALGTFVLMRQWGLSANLMSLGGLAIAIGMLVDGAVVVVENIESHLAHGDSRHLSMLAVVRNATREVAMPVCAGIAIIVIVFLPLLTLEGLEGKLFMPVALTIVFALLVSLLLSLTVIPVLASWLLKRTPHPDPWLVRHLDRLYARALRWAMQHPKALGGIAVAGLVLAGALFTQVGKTFMPTLDEGDMILQLEKLPSVSLSGTLALDLRVQQAILRQVPEVRSVVARSGSDELGLDPMGLNQTDSFLVLKPMSEWRRPDKEWLTEQLREVMAAFPGVDYGFTQPIDMRVSEMLTGVRGDVAIKIYGTDLDTLNTLAEQTEALIAALPGATDTLTLRNDGVQYLRVVVDRQAAGRLGLDAQAIEADLRRWVEGETVGLIQEGSRRTPLVLRGGENIRDDLAAFQDIRLVTPDGQPVPLSEVAHLARVEGPVKVDREQARRYVVVQTNVRGRDLVGFVDEARSRLQQQLKLPAGYSVVWGGQFENQQRAAQRLALVVPVSLGLIFFLLYSTFGSARQAALVLSNVPLAMIGGVVALAMTGEYLSVPASVGFIALLGIAVLNGVVMVSHFNQRVALGEPLHQAVFEGARRRLRPVLMTASICVGGLVPLLFATGPGSEIQRPLAIVVIGGLISSTLLTLLLLPLVYERFGTDPDDEPARPLDGLAPADGTGHSAPAGAKALGNWLLASVSTAAWVTLTAAMAWGTPGAAVAQPVSEATADRPAADVRPWAEQALSTPALQALSGSPTWQAHWLRWQAERTQAGHSRLSDQAWVPGVAIDRLRQRQAPGDASGATGWDQTLSLSRGLSLPARQHAGAQWAAQREQEADTRLRWAWQQSRQSLVEQWGQWLEARWTLEACQAQVAVLTEQLRHMERRWQLGDAARVDTLQLQAAKAQAEARLALALEQHQATEAALTLALGNWRWPAQAQPRAPQHLPPLDATAWPASLEASMAQQQASSLQAEARWQTQQVQQAPTLSVQWGRNSLSAEQRVGLSLNWPLGNPAQAQLARAAQQQADAALAEAKAQQQMAEGRRALQQQQLSTLHQAWLRADAAQRALQAHAEALARGLSLGEGQPGEAMQAHRLAMEQTLETARLAARTLSAWARWQLDTQAPEAWTPPTPKELP